jgi:hypothetical protein
VVLSVEDALLSEQAPADGWVEGARLAFRQFPRFFNPALCILGRCEQMLDMMGMERLQDSALVGKGVTSDLIEVILPNPRRRLRLMPSAAQAVPA